MSTNCNLRGLFSVLGGVLATTLTTSALAQQASDEQVAALEEIVVTGSYLYTGLDSPSPVQVISGDDFVNFSPPDMATFFFDNITQNNETETSAQVDNNSQSRVRGNRVANINLRGLGAENTLVLLNGRRQIATPVPDLNGWRTVDINSMVPRIAIGRADVLLDGGSATFGSDPVAGVVNFVTRDDFTGFDFNIDGRFFEEDASAKNVTIAGLWGAGDRDDHAVLAVEFHQEDAIFFRDVLGGNDFDPNVLPITEGGVGLREVDSLTFSNGRRGPPGETWIDPDCGNPALGAPAIAHYVSYEDSTAAENVRLGDATNPGDFCSSAGNFNQRPLLANNDVQNILIFGSATHRFSDSLTAKAEISINRSRLTDHAKWGDDSSRDWVPDRQQNLGPAFAIPVTNPGYARAASLPALGGDPAFGFNGAGAPVYAVGETLPFQSLEPEYYNANLWRVGLELSGNITGNWNWRVDGVAAYNEAEHAIRDTVRNRYPYAISGLGGPECNFRNIDNPEVFGDPLVDAARGDASQDCYYYNPFMSAALPNAQALGVANDPVLTQWLSPLSVSDYVAEFYSGDVLVTGEFGELPGGPILVAVGAGVRGDDVVRDANELVNNADFVTLSTFNDFTATQKVQSAYFEFALPLADNVDLQVAARYEDYVNSFSEMTPKLAVLYTPTDSLTLRGSIGESFKAPSDIQLTGRTQFAGANRRNVTIDGICYGNCGRSPPVRKSFERIANPDLLAQTSDNISLGFDYDVNDNISVGVSWISIEFDNKIVTPSMPNALSNITCLQNTGGIPDIDVASGDLLYVELSAGGCVTLVDPTAPATIDNVAKVTTKSINLGYLDTEAIDLRARFAWDTGIGLITFEPIVTVVTKYEFPQAGVQGVSGLCPDGVCDGLGRELPRGFNGVQDMSRWRATMNTNLSLSGGHRLRLTLRYTDSVNPNINDLNDTDRLEFIHEPGLWTSDINWNWQYSPASSISASITNLTSQDPPETGDGLFNRRQRMYTLQYRHSFDN